MNAHSYKGVYIYRNKVALADSCGFYVDIKIYRNKVYLADS